MKAHIGVDAESGLVHTVTTTAANAHEVTQAHVLLHGEKEVVFADSGYRGVEKREEIQEQYPDVDGQIAMMSGKRKVLTKPNPAKRCVTSWKNSRPVFGPRWSIRFE
jgi:IS5 family transposase